MPMHILFLVKFFRKLLTNEVSYVKLTNIIKILPIKIILKLGDFV